MQGMMSFAGNIDETLRAAFAEFQEDSIEGFKVNVRRTRAAQLHRLLSDPEKITLPTFQNEVWNIENRTRLRSRNIDFCIFEKKHLLPSLEQILRQVNITLQDMAEALTTGDLELHGNYTWIQGSHIYGPRIKDEQQKRQHIQEALYILNNTNLAPLQKAQAIDKIPGFGENNATGLVMLFHPGEFALVNPVSKGALDKLGVKLTARTPLETIQHEIRALKEALGAQDFLELDWFFYQCSQGKYRMTSLDTSVGPEIDGTWLDNIKLILQEAGEPLHVSEITSRVLARRLPTRGSTPERTVSYVLTTHPKVFERVSEGVYRLKPQIEVEQFPSPEPLPITQGYVEPPFEMIVESILAQKLSIEKQTLRRYHVALKSRGFAILSGISGTGKTWLAVAYAGAVGANYCLVPVAPNWTTNEDLLGYVDPLNVLLYHHTVFSYFLEAAAKEYEQAREERRAAKPYHLVLDEMNLARVEYYFAKFLSAMEVRAREDAAPIDLGAQKIITIYPNLFFVGTINVDETTHGFADKIYDRAQLIELTVSRETLRVHIGDEPYGDMLMDMWDAIHDVAPFAFRVLDEIKKYTTMAVDMGSTWQEAFDEQIVQKILPKCKGADLRIGNALRAMKETLPAATYPLSHAKIAFMLEGFESYGIASYF